ncbi:MAG: hypothetical protein Q8P86_03670 [bacterium]|nr:hypothetical protein [bacterium]
MKKKNFAQNRRGGFIRWIVLLVIILFILAYSGFDLKELVSSPKIKSAFWHTWDFLKLIWSDYIVLGALWLWNDFIVGILWQDIVLPIIDKIKQWFR